MAKKKKPSRKSRKQPSKHLETRKSESEAPDEQPPVFSATKTTHKVIFSVPLTIAPPNTSPGKMMSTIVHSTIAHLLTVIPDAEIADLDDNPLDLPNLPMTFQQLRDCFDSKIRRTKFESFKELKQRLLPWLKEQKAYIEQSHFSTREIHTAYLGEILFQHPHATNRQELQQRISTELTSIAGEALEVRIRVVRPMNTMENATPVNTLALGLDCPLSMRQKILQHLPSVFTTNRTPKFVPASFQYDTRCVDAKQKYRSLLRQHNHYLSTTSVITLFDLTESDMRDTPDPNEQSLENVLCDRPDVQSVEKTTATSTSGKWLVVTTTKQRAPLRKYLNTFISIWKNKQISTFESDSQTKYHEHLSNIAESQTNFDKDQHTMPPTQKNQSIPKQGAHWLPKSCELNQPGSATFFMKELAEGVEFYTAAIRKDPQRVDEIMDMMLTNLLGMFSFLIAPQNESTEQTDE